VFDTTAFGETLLDWYGGAKRTLPWRETQDPYAILVSELMLQQTQVQTVIPYYRRFLKRFPDAAALATAPEEDVLKHWEGLGYYRRARHLQTAARMIVAEHGGTFPRDKAGIDSLKGVGAYTAAAVASIAFALPHACVDGNVIRVITRLHAIDADVSETGTKRRIDGLATEMLYTRDPGDYNQAMMELGATICTPREPSCLTCPVNAFCKTFADGEDPQTRPYKTKKVAVAQIDFASLLLVHQDRFLVCRREDSGLMAGMWELPAQEQQAMRLWETLLDGPSALIARLEKPVRHRFTHLAARYHVEARRASGPIGWRSPPEGYTASRWVRPGDLSELPHTKVLKKMLPIIRDHLEEHPCHEQGSTLPGI